MAETTFRDIHGDGGGAIATGPSLDAFVAADNAAAGAAFDGWFETAGLTGAAVTQVPATASGTKAYYAKWS